MNFKKRLIVGLLMIIVIFTIIISVIPPGIVQSILIGLSVFIVLMFVNRNVVK